MSKLIVGCGYVGHRLARYWANAGANVYVTTRSDERARAFAAENLTPIVLDVTQSELPDLPEVDTVVFAVGFDRSSDHSIERVYVDGLHNILSASSAGSNVERFIYISSTGVYGQTNGELVDEGSTCRPSRPGGAACWAAEELLRNHPTFGSRAILLRLAGIYGPARLPQLRLLQQREPLEVAADAWLNLIHVDDAVRIIAGCERIVAPPLTMCVSDGHAVRRADFYRHLAKLLQLEAPVFLPPAPDSSRAQRARGSKIVSNARLVETLKYDFSFPSFREGLADIVRG